MIPISSAYIFHPLRYKRLLCACRNLLVDKFVEAKRTKEEEIVGEVHSLSAGAISTFNAHLTPHLLNP